jgi:hypothetical protein
MDCIIIHDSYKTFDYCCNKCNACLTKFNLYCCGHYVCLECDEFARNYLDDECPLCCKQIMIEADEKKQRDVMNKIRNVKVACKQCNKQITYGEILQHYKGCVKRLFIKIPKTPEALKITKCYD